MNFREYQFRPRPLPTVIALVSVPVLLGLGVWQLDRAEQKRQLASDMDDQEQAPLMQIDAHPGQEPPLPYRRARADGTFDARHQIYIENRKHGGRVGYHVVTPLKLRDSGSWVLVNRGWIPGGSGSKSQPETPSFEVSVRGRVYVPEAPAIALGDPATWGDIWPYLTLADYQTRYGIQLLPFMLLQDPEDEHGFVREWPRKEPAPAMHLGYAIQWFAFAVIASLIYLRLCLERREKPAE